MNGSVTGAPAISPIQRIPSFGRLFIALFRFVSPGIIAQGDPASKNTLTFTKENHFAFAFQNQYLVCLSGYGASAAPLTLPPPARKCHQQDKQTQKPPPEFFHADVK
jgi:hypothetical protein